MISNLAVYLKAEGGDDRIERAALGIGTYLIEKNCVFRSRTTPF